MPKFISIAALWTLRGHPSPAREWTVEKKISAIAREGFVGCAGRLTPEVRRCAEKHGLTHTVGFVSSSDRSEFGALLRTQKESGAVLVNVQLDDHDTPPKSAVRNWLRMEQEAERLGRFFAVFSG